MKAKNTTRDANASSRRLPRLRLARQPRRPSVRLRGGDDQGTRLARLTARQFRGAPVEQAKWPRFLVAHALWILAVTVAAVGAAGALAHSQTPVYRSEAVVIVDPPAVSASSGNPPNMATEEDLVRSGTVLTQASVLLHVPEAALASGLSVNVPGTTTLLQITYSYSVPSIAQLRAQGIAEAYVAYRSARPGSGRGPGKAAPDTSPTAALVTPASLPTSPSSPDYEIDVGAALIVGLTLGIGTAGLRDYLDDRVRGPLDLAAQTAAPVLALIPAFRPRRRDPGDRLVMVAFPGSVVAEAYRGLRTRLIQAAATGDARILLVTCPSWEDKSTVAANAAAALAQSGRRVILVSADLRWGRAHEPFGLGNENGLSKLLEGQVTTASAVKETDVPGLALVAPGSIPADPAALLQRPALHAVLRDFQRRADVIVIEAPPILASPDALALADLADLILLVADARRSTRARLRLALHEIEHMRGKLAGCALVNVGRGRRLRSRGPAPAEPGQRPAEPGPHQALSPAAGDHYSGQLESAISDLARVIAGRGEARDAIARHEEALADFVMAIDLDPNLAEAVTGRAESGAPADGPEDAHAETRVLDLDLSPARAIGSRGQAYQAMGRHEDALADFNRAIELEPDLAEAMAGRGETYAAMGRHEDALADFTQAIELDPGYAWAIGSRGQVYQAMGRHEDALADFTQAIELDPGLAWAVAGRAETYQDLNRYEEAVADFTRAIELDPRDVWAIGDRGQAYQTLGRHEDALADFTRVISLDRNLTWAVADRAETYQALGRHEEAVADFTRTMELDPKLVRAIAGRGEAYRLMERPDHALADFTRAIGLDPGLAWAIFRRGQVYETLGRHEEAQADFSRAVKLDPGYGAAAGNGSHPAEPGAQEPDEQQPHEPDDQQAQEPGTQQAVTQWIEAW